MSGFLGRMAASQRLAMQQVAPEESARAAEQASLRAKSLASQRLRDSLARPGIRIIAEIKRSSPSAGILRENVDAVEFARAYQDAGAAAISVLTEPRFFAGSLRDLAQVSSAVMLPTLRKDFIVDGYQIDQAAEAGAAAVLLIVAMLDAAELTQLRRHAEETLGIDALVEVHDETEMKAAIDMGATLIGVNNRNLSTLEVDIATSRELAKYAAPGLTLVSESGLRTGRDVRELYGLGYRGFLLGEALMRAPQPGAALRALLVEADHG